MYGVLTSFSFRTPRLSYMQQDYNFQSYAIRRVREQFRDHKALVGSELEAVLKRVRATFCSVSRSCFCVVARDQTN